jgi:hypothetical protein
MIRVIVPVKINVGFPLVTQGNSLVGVGLLVDATGRTTLSGRGSTAVEVTTVEVG